MIENRNSVVLRSFVRYCEEHPELRFWQALRNWSGYNFVLVTNECPVFKDQIDTDTLNDTFYWEGRNGKES